MGDIHTHTTQQTVGHQPPDNTTLQHTMVSAMLPGLLLIAVLTVCQTVSANTCQDYWFDVNGTCFRYIRIPKTVAEAQDICKGEGAKLAFIPDERRWYYLGQHRPDIRSEYWVEDFRNTSHKTSSWTPVSLFTNYTRGQCVLMKHNGTYGDLALADCTDKHIFMCQSTPPADNGLCTHDEFRFDDICLYISDKKRSHDSASRYCRDNYFSGKLVMPTTNRMFYALMTLVLQSKAQLWIGISGPNRLEMKYSNGMNVPACRYMKKLFPPFKMSTWTDCWEKRFFLCEKV